MIMTKVAAYTKKNLRKVVFPTGYKLKVTAIITDNIYNHIQQSASGYI